MDNSERIDRFCRSCLSKSALYFSLNDVYIKSFYELCGIKMNPMTVSPSTVGVCPSCRGCMKRLNMFQRRCVEADNILQTWNHTREMLDDLKKSSVFNRSELLSHTNAFALSCCQNDDESNSTVDRCCQQKRTNDRNYATNIVVYYIHDDLKLEDPCEDVDCKKIERANLKDFCSLRNEFVSESLVDLSSDATAPKNIVKQEMLFDESADASGFESEDNECLNKLRFSERLKEIKKDYIVTKKRLSYKRAKRKNKICHVSAKLEDRGDASQAVATNSAIDETGDSHRLNKSEADLVDSRNLDGSNDSPKKKKKRIPFECDNGFKDGAKRRGGRVIYYRFDSSRVRLLRQSMGEVRQELQNARNAPEYVQAPYQCHPCAKYFVTETSLNMHKEKHTESAGGLVCAICTLRYSTPRSLSIHTQTHTDRYGCVAAGCSKIFRARSAAMRHATNHASSSQLLFQCSVCPHTTSCGNTHKKHVRMHSGEKRYSCTQCSKEFRNSTTRNLHVMRAHTSVRHFACDQCDMTFVNKTALVAHSVKHSEQRNFYCVECDMYFKTASILKCHLNTSTKHIDPTTFKYQCEMCARRYPALHRLREHQEGAHGPAAHSCEACGYAARTPAALRRHNRQRHAERQPRERKHKCTHCDKAFLTRQTLKSHQLTHTGERPYACVVCGKTFRHTAALWTHTKLLHKDKNSIT